MQIHILLLQLKFHHSSLSRAAINFVQYSFDQKCCPFEEIGCMFEHSLSEECKYAEKCNKKLCSFQHITHGVSMNQFKGNSMIDEPLMKTSIYMLSITSCLWKFESGKGQRFLIHYCWLLSCCIRLKYHVSFSKDLASFNYMWLKSGM